MRRMRCVLSGLVALILALGACAQAEIVDCWPGDEGKRMRVIDCEEWVSLRAKPSTKSERLEKIPLYETVFNCREAEGGFIRCEARDGKEGYVLSKYLVPIDFEICSAEDAERGDQFWDDPAKFVERSWTLEFPEQDMHVLCAWESDGTSEKVRVSCFDASDGFVWGLYTSVPMTAELDGSNAFAGATAEHPRVLVHNTCLGLVVIDLATGAPVWTLNVEEESLGGSLSCAVAEDGTIYAGGFYGPDPVAISADGEVLWRSSIDHIHTGRLCGITVEGDEIVADYEYQDEDGYSRVWFDRATGEVTRTER